MRILAIETTAFTGTVALLERDRTVARRILPDDQRSAQSLVPTMKLLLADASWQANSVKLLAVAQGPGSFTGLRVGVATAKAFAYAMGAEVLGVDTLEAMAAQVLLVVERLGNAPSRTIHSILDAQRGQLFAASFRPQASAALALRVSETRVVDLEPWLASLAPDDVVTGPPLAKLRTKLPTGVAAADEALWPPQAEAVGQVAWHHYQKGRRDNLWQLAPQYHRLSAAEEKAKTEGS
jgi:tRNA threonylcarbamoyladenosine biosynthesis protein TsaB